MEFSINSISSGSGLRSTATFNSTASGTNTQVKAETSGGQEIADTVEISEAGQQAAVYDTGTASVDRGQGAQAILTKEDADKALAATRAELEAMMAELRASSGNMDKPAGGLKKSMASSFAGLSSFNSSMSRLSGSSKITKGTTDASVDNRIVDTSSAESIKTQDNVSMNAKAAAAANNAAESARIKDATNKFLAEIDMIGGSSGSKITDSSSAANTSQTQAAPANTATNQLKSLGTASLSTTTATPQAVLRLF